MYKLIVANWKNNPATEEEAVNLAGKTDHENLVICPPLHFLKSVAGVVKKSPLGAQDLPESSAVELKNLGVKYVILGHSDRRSIGETNETIARKLSLALSLDFIPILCVGETWEEKQSGRKEEVLREQIKVVPSGSNIYVAYEPVWAISTSGSGQRDNPVESLETIKFLKSLVQAHFLYGGSVASKNIGDYLKYEEIEGALVGGASLMPEEILSMI